MNWFFGLVVLAGMLAVGRVYYSIQKARSTHQRADFDEQLVARLRADGLDPFEQHRVDFFLAVPDEATSARLMTALRERGMDSDSHPTPDAADFPVSVHVGREVHLTVTAIKAIAAELDALAKQHGGRYDGWALGRRAS